VRTLAVTLGDPAGIGPEVVARTLSSLDLEGTRFLVLGSRSALVKAAERAGVALGVRVLGAIVELDESRLQLLPAGADRVFEKPGVESGRAALAAIELASELALARKVDAVVTAPVSKKHIADGGVPFTGHTEFLAARAHVRHPVMLFVAGSLRVALVTTHLALKKVPAAVTVERVVATAREAARGLRSYFGVMEPRLAVAGLNPHAGEGGQFGREEIEVLTPAIALLKAEGVKAAGPFAADTLFRRAMGGEFDAVVAMYHDQALGPVKTLTGESVNVTLGLPYVRTSVDHGTAFDIAGKGTADAKPMEAAVRLADIMVRATATLL
jgi:4-hydroxythreonine-4-phosphate dehydrogenase